MRYVRDGSCGKRAKGKNFISTPLDRVTMNAYSCRIDGTDGSNRGDPEAKAVNLGILLESPLK